MFIEKKKLYINCLLLIWPLSYPNLKKIHTTLKITEKTFALNTLHYVGYHFTPIHTRIQPTNLLLIET